MHVQSMELLDKVLAGEVEYLSADDKKMLNGNRKEIVEKVESIVKEAVLHFMDGKECEDEFAFTNACELAGCLEIHEVFPALKKMCSISADEIEEVMDSFWITEEMSYVLASTAKDWTQLQSIIEDDSCDELFRDICLHAVINLLAQGKVPRIEIIAYFKSLFSRILEEGEDEDFCAHLICNSSAIWPGECIEEIRECFGLMLVNVEMIGIKDVLRDLARGEEACTNKLQGRLKGHNLGEPLRKNCDTDKGRDIDAVFKKIALSRELADREIAQMFKKNKKLERNDLCFCGSGQKYKKCCLGKAEPLPLPSNMRAEWAKITYEPKKNLEGLDGVPQETQEAIISIYHTLQEDPEEGLDQALMYLAKYSGAPLLYNYAYVGYRQLGSTIEAMDILRETVQKFPHYLFGRVEYAIYFLRRGEPDRAFAALGNAHTLTQLYPERKEFHASEYKSFAYAMGLYFIESNDVKQAKIYLDILQALALESPEAKEIESRIKRAILTRAASRAL